MPRDLPLANGTLAVAFDDRYRLRLGLLPGAPRGQRAEPAGATPVAADGIGRFGVWVDGWFSWLSAAEWILDRRYASDALVTDVRAEHPELGIRLAVEDAVDPHADLLVRRLAVADRWGATRRVRLFVHLGPDGDDATAAYDPDLAAVRFVLPAIGAHLVLGTDPAPAGHAVGRTAPPLEGSWRDAEDGRLSGNATEAGQVDATLQIDLVVPAHGTALAHAWL